MIIEEAVNQQFLSDKFVAVTALAALSILIPVTVEQVFAQENAVTVQTDMDSYETGDTITVRGIVETVVPGRLILLQVFDSQGNLVGVNQSIEVAEDGSFSYSFTAGGLMNADGGYRVMVTYEGTSNQTTFEFDAIETWRTFPLEISGQIYEIRYMITAGSVVDMAASPDIETLLVTINSTSDGILTIELPDQVMDAEDTDFSVFIDEEHGNFVVDELEQTAQSRVISIEFPNGAEEIEIVGTYMVPEFGVIAAGILAITILGTIAASSRYQRL